MQGGPQRRPPCRPSGGSCSARASQHNVRGTDTAIALVATGSRIATVRCCVGANACLNRKQPADNVNAAVTYSPYSPVASPYPALSGRGTGNVNVCSPGCTLNQPARKSTQLCRRGTQLVLCEPSAPTAAWHPPRQRCVVKAQVARKSRAGQTRWCPLSASGGPLHVIVHVGAGAWRAADDQLSVSMTGNATHL